MLRKFVPRFITEFQIIEKKIVLNFLHFPSLIVLLWFYVVCWFGVRVSVTFHLMCVHIIFSSVRVAEWPPFGKDLLTRLSVFFVF